MGTTANTFRIYNVKLVKEEAVIDNGELRVEDGIIVYAGPKLPTLPLHFELSIDGEGRWLLPGFVDVHVHGGAGADFMDATPAAFRAIMRFHACRGTTAMLATTITAPKARLEAVLHTASRYKPMGGARLLGIHLEGPFISPKHPGAQNPAHIVPPRPDWLREWLARFPGLLRIVTLAPETEGALELIRLLCSHSVIAAAGHTDAAYEQMLAAADAGLTHAVHTYNAMRGLHHREPGAVGAVLTDQRISAELITDGRHVHEAALRLALQAKGTAKTLLVSDAMAAAGMPDGRYELGGLGVTVKAGTARLTESGALAGSTITLLDAYRFAVGQLGVSPVDACRMACLNPARLLGMDGICGSLAEGKQADAILLGEDGEPRQVWISGEPLLT
ncbi:N-acetylglucosamine-6-phosphate deacetylase [Paenibacillus turpanensis]|uniref:N-acetylglucosamine-6-phosphate deacetylase n=1 Tax=Paenibacillus turpanensis TaxID=2689078 RepID=UPI00140813FF|nr:N-acetylglucosamine-6-phosphate deacetylase [Paenibacillus turpanensis]